MKNEHRGNKDRQNPPGGADHIQDRSHALRAGEKGASPRKQATAPEKKTRDEGRDDRRSGSESHRGRH